MPQVIRLVTSFGDDAFAALKNGKIDVLPTFINDYPTAIKQALEDDASFNTHETIPIRVQVIFFTPKAIRKFTREQRLFAARQLALKARKLAPFGARDTTQFFQSLSEGSLSGARLKEISELRASDARPKFPNRITIKAVASSFAQRKIEFADVLEIEVLSTKMPSYQLPLSERPDMYMASSDSAWTESISLISYNFDYGLFHLPGVSGKEWLNTYLKIQDHAQRIQKLADLHYQLLKEVVIYPVFASPYFAVAIKPWRLNFSTLHEGSELWLMRYSP
jgi:hypothetical protein